MFPDVWNVLHDGSLITASGTVPGTVQLGVSIDYLRDRFPDPGKVIRLTLSHCTRFAYREFGEQEFTTNLAAIAAVEPEILNAEMAGGLTQVVCANGTLEVAAAGGSLMLDSGRQITLEELLTVAEAYWNEFEKRSKL